MIVVYIRTSYSSPKMKIYSLQAFYISIVALALCVVSFLLTIYALCSISENKVSSTERINEKTTCKIEDTIPVTGEAKVDTSPVVTPPWYSFKKWFGSKNTSITGEAKVDTSQVVTPPWYSFKKWFGSKNTSVKDADAVVT